jgi:acetyltransferase-like isoleucine patch superfamily enzyme
MNFLMAGVRGQAKDLMCSFRYENYMREITLYDDVSQDLPEKLFNEYPILKSEEAARKYFKEVSPLFMVAVASPSRRRMVAEKLKALGGYNMSFLSSKSLISRHNTISEDGVIVQVSCEVSSDVTLERGVLLNVKCMIGHDAYIGEYTTLAPNVKVLGYAHIGNNCVIAHGVTIMPKVKIGNNVKIGMNQLIRKDIPDNTNLF